MRRVPLTLGLTFLLSGAAVPPIARAVAGPPSTGNVMVLLDRGAAVAAAGRSSVRATAARLRARPAGRSVPEIGLITLRPPAGVTATAFAATLDRLPGVASVALERRYVPRSVPNDPALHAASGVAQWALARENFPAAWDLSHGDGALVGVLDTGIDASHPDLAGKIAGAFDQQADPSLARGTANTDEVGHGTHVASLACAGTNNGIGMAGAGYNCRLVVEKSDFSESSIAAAIVDAANQHVDALNMSFGPAQPTANPAPASEVRALQYAAAHNVVLVAAAADSPGNEQGDPANVLQPAGTAPTLTQGLGLDVTAADYSGNRASFAGSGSEISLAAFGAFKPDETGLLGLGAPVPGIFGAFPSNQTDLDSPVNGCGCRTTFGGSNRYAYLQGTSMAAPQVTATAAMMRVLNPYATVSDVITTLKATATRPSGTGWTSNLGWGILNAGAALDAVRRIDRVAPVSKLSAPRTARRREFALRWAGHDQNAPELIASGIARYDVYARAGGAPAQLVANTAGHTLLFRGRAGVSYVFFTVAIDRAGNRESRPVEATTRVTRSAR